MACSVNIPKLYCNLILYPMTETIYSNIIRSLQTIEWSEVDFLKPREVISIFNRACNNWLLTDRARNRLIDTEVTFANGSHIFCRTNKNWESYMTIE